MKNVARHARTQIRKRKTRWRRPNLDRAIAENSEESIRALVTPRIHTVKGSTRRSHSHMQDLGRATLKPLGHEFDCTPGRRLEEANRHAAGAEAASYPNVDLLFRPRAYRKLGIPRDLFTALRADLRDRPGAGLAGHWEGSSSCQSDLPAPQILYRQFPAEAWVAPVMPEMPRVRLTCMPGKSDFGSWTLLVMNDRARVHDNA